MSIVEYGSGITSNLLNCFGTKKHLMSTYLSRIAFLVVMTCHIPFVFFSGKEAFLIIIEEIRTGNMTESLEFKLKKCEKEHI